jgi:hypothetical protein
MVYVGKSSMRWVRISVVALLLSAVGIAAALFVPDIMKQSAGTPEHAAAAAPGDPAGATQAGTARRAVQEGGPDVQPGVQPDAAGDDPPEPPAGQDEPGAGVAEAGEDPAGVAEPTRPNRRRPPRQRRDAPRPGTPDRQADPAPDPGGASEPVASTELSPARVKQLYHEVGRLMDRMAKERPGPGAKAMSDEYFLVPFSASETNAKLRPDVWEQLQRLRQRARRELE